MKTKTTITKVVDLSTDEVGDLLIPALAEKINADGELGKITGGHAKDLGGLSAEVTLTFQSEGVT